MSNLKTSRARYTEFRQLGHKKWQEKREAEDKKYGRETEKPDPRKSDDPKVKAEAKARRRKYLRQYAHLVKPYKWMLLGLFILSVLVAGMDMVGPALLGYVVDDVLDNADKPVDAKKHELLVVCGFWLALLLGSRLINTLRWYGVLSLNSELIVRLRKRLHRRLMRLSLTDIQEMKTGKIVSRLSHDVSQAMGLLQQGLLSPAAASVRLLMTVGVLCWWNWRLAIAAVAILPPVLYISLQWINRVRPIFRSAGEDQNETDGRVTETFSGIRVVRSFGREVKEVRDAALGYHTTIRKNLYAHRIAAIVDIFWEMLIPLTSLAIIFIGGNLLLANSESTSLGQIMAFNAYTGMLLWPMWQIVASLNHTQQSLAAMERVFEIFEKPVDKVDPPDAVEAPAIVHQILFDDVDFEYRSGTPIISDFTLEVRGGSVVALVGPSGAGKTTITDLLARFYDPTNGTIYLNGTDIRQIRLASYRKLFALVQQETFLFDGTVAENVAYGRKNASRDEIVAAAKRANAHAFIEELPEGYDTLIGERGLKLSGGQRQRMSIARAILADPQILILDEATSNLDSESEQLIQAAMKELSRSRTTFVIAHRLSTIVHADLIVVIEKGKILETGTHEQLVATGGLYAQMVERQRTTAAEAFDTERAFDRA